MAEKLLKFPSWIKPPVVDDYRVEPVDRRLKSEMEIGSVSRMEFDTDETVATCTLWLKSIQAKWFEGFERDLTRQGTRWFIMPLWVGGELLDHVVKFRERPKLSQKTGEYCNYSFTLDVSRREGLFPADVTEFLIDVDPAELSPLVELLQTIVNVDWPRALPR